MIFDDFRGIQRFCMFLRAPARARFVLLLVGVVVGCGVGVKCRRKHSAAGQAPTVVLVESHRMQCRSANQTVPT